MQGLGRWRHWAAWKSRLLVSLGLQAEVLWNLTLIIILAVFTLSLVLLSSMERDLLKYQVEKATILLDGLAQQQTDSDNPMNLKSLPTSLAGPWRQQGIESIMVVDENFIPLMGIQVEGLSRREVSEFQNAAASKNLAVFVPYVSSIFPLFNDPEAMALITIPIFQGGRMVGFIQGRVTLEDVRLRMAKMARWAFFFIVSSCILFVGFGWYLLRQSVLLPVKRLVAASGQVAKGEYPAGISLEGPKELVELAVKFNDMVGRLKESRIETETHIQSLQTANRALTEARQELIRSEKLASVGQLAAGMAHEIGNPLGAIIGYLNFMKGETVEPQLLEILARSLSEAERIDRLVRDLLDFARPQSVGSYEPADPVSVIRDVVDRLNRQGQFSLVRLEDHLPEKLSLVAIDQYRLMQVLINILRNACDASPKNGVIGIYAGEEEHGVWISVTDEGAGVPEDQREKIFEPFFTTKDPGQGRGLGLFISHHILTHAGGSIEITSNTHQGSCFTIRLQKA